MPDVLTGRSFAHAGIAMGLCFGLASIGYGLWAHYSMKSSAMEFARKFSATLDEVNQARPINTADVLWFMIEPEVANTLTPAEAPVRFAEMLKGSDQARSIEQMIRQMLTFAGQGIPIVPKEVENLFVQDGSGYASVLLRVGEPGHAHGKMPATREEGGAMMGEGPDHALIFLKGSQAGQNYRWYVKQVQYPYQPKTFTPEPVSTPVDDGHGHAH